MKAMFDFLPTAWRVVAVVCSILPLCNIGHAAALIPVGAARVDISPKEPVPLMGYAARANTAPSGQIAQRIYARALAFGDDGKLAILVTIENCILPGAITAEVRKRLADQLAVRPECVALMVTHTHSAPCLTGAAPNIFAADIAAADQRAIDSYTRFLVDSLEQVSRAAVADRKPAQLAWGQGRAGFARNRRTANGPVDQALPVLSITSPDGELRALFLSYACHCTTLGGDFNAVHGDWAGAAAEKLERSFPHATVLVAIGCGADANPEPRGTVELVARHGEEIALEARRMIETKLLPITTPPECRLKQIELPFEPHFSREQWEQRASGSGIVAYHARKWLARLDRGEKPPATLPYPVQSWNFGEQLALVFLGGEVVVDYSLRLKRELDPKRLWINAYANDVPCYIPSRRVLREGGYEAESSLWYYDRPQRLAPQSEDLIIAAVRELVPRSFLLEGNASELPPPKCAVPCDPAGAH